MLDTLCGNAQLKESLKAALAAGKLAHSILLCGEEGVGTGYAARCLAADYLCPQGGAAAQAVLRGESSECTELAGEGASGNIKVARVRQARREMFNSALSAEGRVMILFGVENLNVSSANSLLKVLEEPPEGALFLLTAPSAAVVLPTLRSRCAGYTLAPVSEAECAAWLRENCPACKGRAPRADAEKLARVFEGHIGTALAVAGDEKRRRTYEDAVALAHAVAQGQEYELLRLLARYEKDRPGAAALLRDLNCLAAAALRRPQESELPPARAAHTIPRVDAALRALQGNGNARLVLTGLGMRLAQA